MTKNTTYINNGIDIIQMRKQTQDCKIFKNNKITVYTIGRICHQKNPELFNNIAMKMSNVKFIWIGDGELKDELTSPNIEVTGWLERNEVIKKSMNSDVFILTSLWEGLPISLLESMYMKKLCIVSDVIGNHDVIQNGKNGFVCSNVYDFVEAINKSIENNEQLINQAYKDILTKYNTKVMAKKYKDIYVESLDIV